MKKIRELNKQYQNIILSEIKRVEEQNGKIQELSNPCQRLFDQFREKQSQCIEMLSFKSLQDYFKDTQGIELITPLQTKIGIASSIISGGVIIGDVSIAGYWAASTLITPVGVAATGVLGAGLLLIAIKKMIVESKFNSVQDVESKLILLENALNSRIAEVCQDFISNNNQTIQCLKELFKVFAEGHLFNSQTKSDTSHQDSACLQSYQTQDEEFFQMSFKEQQKQYQASSMQYWDEIQGKFFSEFNSILDGIKKNILFWKKFDSKKLDLVQNLIEQEENEYNILKDIKIYIVIKGTISAGKSTFLNALLGGQILPQKKSSCTKQIIEITYNEQIIINGEHFEFIDKARGKLKEMQNNNELISVKVGFPSLFHLDFQESLRSRIILIDTPGITLQKDQFKSNPYEKLDEMIGNNPIINVWISNYTTFSQDQERIFSFLEIGKKKEQDIQNNLGVFQFIDQRQQLKQVEKEQCKDKILFLLNKYDERDEGNDDPIQPIIDDICSETGDNNFILKISAKQAQEHRIMTFGSQMSQRFFIEKQFSTDKKQNGYSSENKQKGKVCLINNQEFNDLICLIQKQIELKINSELNEYRLLFIFISPFGLQNINKQTDKLKASVVAFILNIHNIQIDYEIRLQQINNIYQQKTLQLLDNLEQYLMKLSLLNRISIGFQSVLQEVCQEIFQNEVLMGKEITDLNNQIQQKILAEIFKIEKLNEINSELSNTCQCLFKKFSYQQNLSLEISHFQIFSEMVNNIFECFLTKFEKPISSWLPIVRLVTLGPAFLVPVLLFKLVQVSEVKEKNLIVSDVKENFNSLKELQITRIDGVCERHISNNNQIISCLKNLFSRLIQ